MTASCCKIMKLRTDKHTGYATAASRVHMTLPALYCVEQDCALTTQDRSTVPKIKVDFTLYQQ